MIEVIIGIVCLFLVIYIFSLFMNRKPDSSNHYPNNMKQSNLERDEIECRKVLPADECRWQRNILNIVS